MDKFGLVQSVDGLGQGIVVAVALAANRRRDVCLGKPLTVADGDILRAPDALLSVKRLPGRR